MVVRQVFHEDGSLLDQVRVGLLATEARAGRGAGESARVILGRRAIRSGVVPNNSAAISQ